MPIDIAALQPNADRLVDRLEILAKCSEPGDGVTRRYLTPEHRQAADLLLAWMTDAGLEARIDNAGNVVGRYEGERPGLACLMLGSHQDSVLHGGRYDGPLGVLTALESVAALHAVGATSLPFAIEVIAFGDEEGGRFPSVLMGSRAIAGKFDQKILDCCDADGVTMARAMRQFGVDPAAIGSAAYRREDVLAYVELHIEQGPVLEAEDLPVGAVSGICGQTRQVVRIESAPGHAGTVPMGLRRDPLLAAAELFLKIEAIAKARPPMVATVGKVSVEPGAGNVIPGHVEFTADLRSPSDELRHRALAELHEHAEAACRRRRVGLEVSTVFESDATACAPWLIGQLEQAIQGEGISAKCLPSGAGHDGIALADLTDIGMLFVRCEGGVSHDPAEYVEPRDIEAALRVMLRFVATFRPQGSRP